MSLNTVLIVVHGELPEAAELRRLASSVQKIICTDGAARPLLEAGVVPDVVIGDLDSLDSATKEALPASCSVVYRPSQYATDFEKALVYAEELGATNLYLTGLKGGRFDHQCTNLSIVKQHAARFLIHIFDREGCGVVLAKEGASFHFPDIPEETVVSLIPLGRVEGISTKGLLYPLEGELLEFGERNGQSNQVVGHGSVSLSLSRGTLLVYFVGPWSQRQVVRLLSDCTVP